MSCGGGPGEVKFIVAADVDGDGREEIVVAINRAGVKASEFWVMDFDPATLTWRHLSQIAGNAAGADFVCLSLPTERSSQWWVILTQITALK